MMAGFSRAEGRFAPRAHASIDGGLRQRGVWIEQMKFHNQVDQQDLRHIGAPLPRVRNHCKITRLPSER
jgi:hypothetical protein